MSTTKPKRDQDEDFAGALTRLLDTHGVSQQRLADGIGLTRASVNDWCRGRSLPAPATVFAIERYLDVRPGSLSATLGYYPPEALQARPAGVVDAIRDAPELTEQARRLLLVMYEELARPPSSRRRP